MTTMHNYNTLYWSILFVLLTNYNKNNFEIKIQSKKLCLNTIEIQDELNNNSILMEPIKTYTCPNNAVCHVFIYSYMPIDALGHF